MPARVLLKCLLDETARRLLKEHSQIIVDQVDPPTPLEKLSVSTQGGQSHEKETTSNKDREVDITLQKEQRLSQKWSRAVEAVLANGLEQRKKRCKLCQRNTINHIDPTVNCLSKEASETIERIDSCLSALRIRNSYLENKSSSPALREQYSGILSVGRSPRYESFMGRSGFSSQTNRPFSYQLQPVPCFDSKALNESDASGRPGESFEKCEFMGEKVNSIHDQNGGPTVEKIDLGNWIMNLNDFLIHNVQNLSETSYKTPTWPATFSTIPLVKGLYQSRAAMEDECSTHRLFQMYKTPGSFMYPDSGEKFKSVEDGLNVSSISKSGAKNHPHNIMNETLSNNKPPRLLDPLRNPSERSYEGKTGKTEQCITARRVSLMNQEPGSAATDSYSNWRTWKGRSISSDKEYTSTEQTGEYVTSSTCSQNGTSSQSYDTEDDAYVSSNCYKQDSEPVSSASSISKGYSSSDQPTPLRASLNYSSASKKSSSSQACRANNGKKLKKRAGMWRRMKEKMAIIFHHHHHHYHHHHHHDGRGFSLKQKDANFDEEAYGEKAVGKMKKSIVNKKNQPSHFHALMEGLWKHVRHSKQSKPRKENTMKFAKSRHDRHKPSKKPRWWKLLQHRRKFPNKTNVKLALGKKKARLKALPSIN